MYNYLEWEVEEIDVAGIRQLYELRHACNVVGYNKVAGELSTTKGRLLRLCNSDIHGSLHLKGMLRAKDDKFDAFVKLHLKEERERSERIQAVHDKNQSLIIDLKKKRKEFAGIGTNKAKRRLNKAALVSPVAKAARMALEIEDKSVSAKNSYGKYQNRIYNTKTKLILELCQLFKDQKWIYGIQRSDVPPTTHVIYFEIPSCEQISWHFTPDKPSNFPAYKGDWDKKKNATLDKLESITKKILEDG